MFVNVLVFRMYVLLDYCIWLSFFLSFSLFRSFFRSECVLVYTRHTMANIYVGHVAKGKNGIAKLALVQNYNHINVFSILSVSLLYFLVLLADTFFCSLLLHSLDVRCVYVMCVYIQHFRRSIQSIVWRYYWAEMIFIKTVILLFLVSPLLTHVASVAQFTFNQKWVEANDAERNPPSTCVYSTHRVCTRCGCVCTPCMYRRHERRRTQNAQTIFRNVHTLSIASNWSKNITLMRQKTHKIHKKKDLFFVFSNIYIILVLFYFYFVVFIRFACFVLCYVCFM